MKSLRITLAGFLLIAACTVQSQIDVSINIGTPPLWGPVGYSSVNYYYLPDIETFYEVNSGMFIYNGGKGWIRRSYLPRRYRNYDLYNGYKVVMSDYHGNAPYNYYHEYKWKYAKGYRGEPQHSIGQKPGRRGPGHDISHDRKQHQQQPQRSKGQSKGKKSGHGRK